MDELINVLVIWVVGIIAGMVLHSAGGHAGYNQRVRDWIERNLLGKQRCVHCGDITDNYCIIETGEPGQNWIEGVWVRLGYEGQVVCAECYYK